MLRRAVRTFMVRRVFRRAWLWGGVALLLVGGLALGVADGPSFYTGLAAAGLLFLAILVAAVWRAHLNNTLGRFRALDPPEADLACDDAGLAMASSEGSATVPWSRFKEVWALPDCWMLFTAESQFITLPLGDLSPDAIRFISSRLPAPT